jgi:hypothetical protein
MIHLDAASGTLCVNTAVVPREEAGKFGEGSKRHFCLVEFEGTKVAHVRHVWVDVDIATGACELASEQNMLRHGAQLETWNSNNSSWQTSQQVARA